MSEKRRKKTPYIDRLIFEKTTAFSITLKESEAERIRYVSGRNGLSRGIRDCLDMAEMVVELGEGNYMKGKIRLAKLVVKLKKKRAEGMK